MITTRALCTFGVGFRRELPLERSVLAVADEFRTAICDLYQERHEAVVDLRNELFPRLYAALVEYERLYWSIVDCERRIKAYHSEVRDRNAVSPTLDAELRALREQRTASQNAVRAGRGDWSQVLRTWSAWWRTRADWKNVKSLAARRLLYAAVETPEVWSQYEADLTAADAAAGRETRAWPPVDPTALVRYGALWMDFDLRERDVYSVFAGRLHPAIRAEIVESSQPKLKIDAPGMRYQYGRRPEPKPWEKLSLQFVGGLSWADAVAGKSRQFGATLWRRNAAGDAFYRIRQQIGTQASPLEISYILCADRPIPPEAILQRWTLAVRPNGKREAIPIVKWDHSKPSGEGALAYRLRWTKRKAGVEVAQFWGDHVQERLVIPQHIVDLRQALKREQTACDLAANAVLARRGATPATGRRQGVAALVDYVRDNPDDSGAAESLGDFQRRLASALRTSQRAVGCIEKIYETVASRVCRLHATITPSTLDIASLKRYDSRDLLAGNAAVQPVREILHALAPGKLKAILDGYGLAKTDVAPEPPRDARETDLFTTYVASIGGRTGSKRAGRKRRSRISAETLTG